jgi:hypothetical protein
MGGDGESPAHAPRFPYRLDTQGTVWGFGLTTIQKMFFYQALIVNIAQIPFNNTVYVSIFLKAK